MKLHDIPLKDADLVRQAALMQMQLYVIAQTHAGLGTLNGHIQKGIRATAKDDNTLDVVGLLNVNKVIETRWNEFYDDWTTLLQVCRREAAAIALGTIALYHEHLITPARTIQEAVDYPLPFYEQTLDAMILAANQRLFNNMNLSARIWDLGHTNLTELQRRLYAGITVGQDAWTIAQDIEQHLGFGADCPRWAWSRLYSLSKTAIAAGDRTGLFTGEQCAGQGVSYNALRVARTEIQYIHNMMFDDILEHIPFVDYEQIVLSAAHPEEDICDDVAFGGENGDGTYPKGEIELPLHPNCVTPGQLVQTNEGMKAIEDISAGDLVLSHTGSYQLVVAAWSRGYTGAIYEFETPMGKFELTGNHPVLLRRGWVEARGVEVEDDVLYASDNIATDNPVVIYTYTAPIQLKRQRDYDGLVYNMEVEKDNSYTVNGAVVHNCICFKLAVLPPIEDLIGRLRGWVGGEAWPGMDIYQSWLGVDMQRGRGTGLGWESEIAGWGDAMIAWAYGTKAQIDRRLEQYR